jgi:hypothetical protein
MQAFNTGHLEGFLTNLDAIANQKQPVVESDMPCGCKAHKKQVLIFCRCKYNCIF